MSDFVPWTTPSVALSPGGRLLQRIVNDDLVFYGIQAPKEIFEKYRYLLKVSDACNWSSDQNAVHLSTRLVGIRTFFGLFRGTVPDVEVAVVTGERVSSNPKQDREKGGNPPGAAQRQGRCFDLEFRIQSLSSRSVTSWLTERQPAYYPLH